MYWIRLNEDKVISDSAIQCKKSLIQTDMKVFRPLAFSCSRGEVHCLHWKAVMKSTTVSWETLGAYGRLSNPREPSQYSALPQVLPPPPTIFLQTPEMFARTVTLKVLQHVCRLAAMEWHVRRLQRQRETESFPAMRSMVHELGRHATKCDAQQCCSQRLSLALKTRGPAQLKQSRFGK